MSLAQPVRPGETRTGCGGAAPRVKHGIDELAVFGGTPVFAEPLHVGRPNMGDRASLMRRLDDILDRRWFTNNGTYVQQFERRIAEMVGVEHCIAMCNATVALEIATRALGLTGEVIVPSFTFIATAHALQWQEITPVFCDIDAHTHTIDPACVEPLITPRTTGIIGVHTWGRPCDVEGLTKIAAKHDLRLLFDAAHAFGCSHGERRIGAFGEAEVFSFHATKVLNTFEGGAVVTNDDQIARRIRLMKNFGFAGTDQVIYIGTNGKMTEFSAAVGLTSLESLDEFVGVNRRNFQQYQRELAGIPGLRLLDYERVGNANFQYVVLELAAPDSPMRRDDLVEVLHAEGVLARRYFFPGCHRMEPYASFFPHASLLLPITESLVRRVVVLPTGTAVEESAVAEVCALIRLVLANADTVSGRLRERRA